LGRAINHEGDGLVEFKLRPAVQRGEGLAVEFKGNHEYRPRRAVVKFLARLTVVGHFCGLGVGKDRRIERDGLLGLGVEPKTRGDAIDLRHDDFP
jgi:hypothetical protein